MKVAHSMKQIIKAALTACCLFGLTTGTALSQKNGEVNIYSARHYPTDARLYQDFENATGIKVNRIEGKGDGLLQRLLQEGDFSPADLFITVDIGRLWKAQEANIFQPISSSYLEENIPKNLRSDQNLWYGLSKRARIFFYDPNQIDPSLIQTYEDLARPDLKGKICIRSGSNIYNLSLLASLIAHHGEEKAEEWARNIVANMARPPQGGDRDQIRAVAAGECAVAVANSYYFAAMMSGAEEDQAVTQKLSWIFPNQQDRGTHVNVAGAGVIRTAPNRDNAILLLEYLASTKGQKHFAELSNEYPIVENTDFGANVEELGTDFLQDTVALDKIGENQILAQKIMDRVGWK